MDLIIKRLNGESYRLSDHGIKTLDFVVDSPTLKHETENIENRQGFIDFGTAYGGRTMSGSFIMKAKDLLDYTSLRNKVFNLIDSKEIFYLSDSRELGKQWLVKVSSSFSIEQIKNYGKFSISFVSPNAFAESVGTTLDPRTFDVKLWQVGQGLILENLSYAHNTTTFSIYNAGDVTIDPRELPLLIKYQGASNGLRIRNQTTGDEWSYSGSSTSNQSIELNGIRSLKNGSIFKDTNRKLITLASGWNDFTLTGTSGSFLVSFDFRFYYL